MSQARFDKAEPLVERSLAIRERVLGSEHPDVARSLNTYAELLTSQVRTLESCFVHQIVAPLLKWLLHPLFRSPEYVGSGPDIKLLKPYRDKRLPDTHLWGRIRVNELCEAGPELLEM